MITSISSQATIFLCTVIGGAVIALIYDLFRILRKTVRTGSLVIHVEDLLYWLIVSIVMFMTIYYSNDGELRVFMFIGACIGVILYVLLLSRIVMASSLFIIRIVSYPFIFVFRILKAPVCMFAQLVADCIRMTAVSIRKAASEAKASAKTKCKIKAMARAKAKAEVKAKRRQRRSQRRSEGKEQVKPRPKPKPKSKSRSKSRSKPSQGKKNCFL